MAMHVQDSDSLVKIQAVQCLTASAKQLSGNDGITSDRKRVRITNLGPNTIFIGTSSAVTAANGYPVAAAAEREFRLDSGQDLWGIASTADQSSPADTRVYEGA